jgi:hypothetical protein
MRLILQALISVLSFVRTTQAFEAASVPVQYKDHEIQLPGSVDKLADPGPFPAVILLHGCIAYQEHLPHSTAWSSMPLGDGYASWIVDSFKQSGGYSCDGAPFSARALDVLATADFLRETA